MNSRRRSLIEWDEKGAGLYFTEGSFSNTKIESYYFYKREKQQDGLVPETRLHTIGARISGSPADCFSFAVEGACQYGHRGNYDRTGFGGY
ncbi:MAG: hypothetical protein KAX38_06420, partial [Candidatus Krumholzibacteria bacterium]|nr:hypothetical protein [Candidatus Krumholzibacteria bacterium]